MKSLSTRRGSLIAILASAAGAALVPSIAVATPVPASTLYLSSTTSVLAVATNATSTTLNPNAPEVAAYGETVDPAGNLFSADYGNGNGQIYEYPGGAQNTATPLSSIPHVTQTGPIGSTYYNGNVYVAGNAGVIDEYSDTNGTLSTSPISSTSIASASLYGLASDGSGNLYVADSTNSTLYKIALSGGALTTPTSYIVVNYSANQLRGVAIDGQGKIFVSGDALYSGSTNVAAPVIVVTPGVTPSQATFGTVSLYRASGLAFDANGNLFAADQLTSSTSSDWAVQQIGNNVGGVTTALVGGPQTFIDTGGNNNRFMTFAPVPEPASLGLLGLGLTAAALRRKRRSAQ